MLQIATLFRLGFLSKTGPGTLASLASLLLWAPCVFLEISFWGRMFLVLSLSCLGWYATARVLPQFKSLDPKEIVIDEAAGQGLALIFCPPSWWMLLWGFGLFRMFDILKPWPISYIDRKFKSAFGVMLDDLMAGFIAAMILLAYGS